jgi:hypothetical protein
MTDGALLDLTSDSKNPRRKAGGYGNNSLAG